MDVSAEELVSKAKEYGFDKCGIIPVEMMAGYSERLTERIERFPEAKERYEAFRGFAEPRKNFPWARSVIVCAYWCGKYKIPENARGYFAKFYLVDGRRNAESGEHKANAAFAAYMRGRGLRIAAEHDFGAAALRWAAMKAGIGIIRKNNFFYTERGSWNSLSAYHIDAPLEHIERRAAAPCPGGCSLCVKSCPTRSLAAPYAMNIDSCVSSLTTWGGWDLTAEPLRAELGAHLYGCDDCQDVCPFNSGAWSEDEEFPGLAALGEHLSPASIIEADYDFLRDFVQPAFWYIPADRLWRYKTNALNVMLNDYRPEYLPAIKKACSDASRQVRRMARWTLERLAERGELSE